MFTCVSCYLSYGLQQTDIGPNMRIKTAREEIGTSLTDFLVDYMESDPPERITISDLTDKYLESEFRSRHHSDLKANIFSKQLRKFVELMGADPEECVYRDCSRDPEFRFKAVFRPEALLSKFQGRRATDSVEDMPF